MRFQRGSREFYSICLRPFRVLTVIHDPFVRILDTIPLVFAESAGFVSCFPNAGYIGIDGVQTPVEPQDGCEEPRIPRESEKMFS